MLCAYCYGVSAGTIKCFLFIFVLTDTVTVLLRTSAHDVRAFVWLRARFAGCVVVVQAGDIKSPEGTLAVTYDARGFMYEIPLYCYSSPSNIISDEEASTPKRSGHKGPVSDLPITVRLSSSVRAGLSLSLSLSLLPCLRACVQL